MKRAPPWVRLHETVKPRKGERKIGEAQPEFLIVTRLHEDDKKNGLAKSDYNQVANYAYMQSEINIRIGIKSPKEYLAGVKEQCSGDELRYGRIDSMDALLVNFRMNAIPESVFEMELANYENFLSQRRRLMATTMRDFYFSL